jgi:predicted Zn-dependent protease
MTTFAEVEAAFERGDHAAVLALTDAILAERPGDDAAHELRARSMLALERLPEAEEHAQAAVRLDPDEIRYRELLATVLSAIGAHRDAAVEYGRLARNDPRQPDWTIAEAEERMGAEEAGAAVEAARRAVRLEPRNGQAQLALARALTRAGDAPGAFQAAGAATRLLGNLPEAREVLADARWLGGHAAEALAGYAALARELDGEARDRVVDKARRLYRQHAGSFGGMVARVPGLFGLALRLGWLRLN